MRSLGQWDTCSFDDQYKNTSQKSNHYLPLTNTRRYRIIVFFCLLAWVTRRCPGWFKWGFKKSNETQDLIWYQKYVGIARHWPSRALRAPPGGGDWRPCPQLFPKLPGTDFSHKAFLKTLMPLKVQLPLPPIGLELYQLGVHMRAKRNYYQQ